MTRILDTIRTALGKQPLLPAVAAVIAMAVWIGGAGAASAASIPFETVSGGTYGATASQGGVDTTPAYGAGQNSLLGHITERYLISEQQSQEGQNLYPYTGAFRWIAPN